MLVIILILTAVLAGLIFYVLRKDQQRKYAEIVNQGQRLLRINLHEQIDDIRALAEPAIESDPAIMITAQATESALISSVIQSPKNQVQEQMLEQSPTPWKERCKSYRSNN